MDGSQARCTTSHRERSHFGQIALMQDDVVKVVSTTFGKDKGLCLVRFEDEVALFPIAFLEPILTTNTIPSSNADAEPKKNETDAPTVVTPDPIKPATLPNPLPVGISTTENAPCTISELTTTTITPAKEETIGKSETPPIVEVVAAVSKEFKQKLAITLKPKKPDTVTPGLADQKPSTPVTVTEGQDFVPEVIKPPKLPNGLLLQIQERRLNTEQDEGFDEGPKNESSVVKKPLFISELERKVTAREVDDKIEDKIPKRPALPVQINSSSVYQDPKFQTLLKDREQKSEGDGSSALAYDARIAANKRQSQLHETAKVNSDPGHVPNAPLKKGKSTKSYQRAKDNNKENEELTELQLKLHKRREIVKTAEVENKKDGTKLQNISNIVDDREFELSSMKPLPAPRKPKPKDVLVPQPQNQPEFPVPLVESETNIESEENPNLSDVFFDCPEASAEDVSNNGSELAKEVSSNGSELAKVVSSNGSELPIPAPPIISGMSQRQETGCDVGVNTKVEQSQKSKTDSRSQLLQQICKGVRLLSIPDDSNSKDQRHATNTALPKAIPDIQESLKSAINSRRVVYDISSSEDEAEPEMDSNDDEWT